MKIFSLYRDFFRFLEASHSISNKWSIYSSYYYKPHKEFLDNYFSHFPLIDSVSLKQRVERARASDYSWLRSLVSFSPPEKIICEAYKNCTSIVPPMQEPEVYLFIGFFSPDGFVMDFRGKPAICFGLERYRDFRLLKILFAHEYSHFLLNLAEGEIPEGEELKWLLISEGIGTYFSKLAISGNKLSDHFLFDRDRLNWCQANEYRIRDIYTSGVFSSHELMDFYLKGNPELHLPPRAGKYLGFQAAKKYMAQNREKGIASLLSDKELALSLEL